MLEGPNVCADSKPQHADAVAEDNYFANTDCTKFDAINQAFDDDNLNVTAADWNVAEQSGTNVTAGYKGSHPNTLGTPILTTYFEAGLCPVNVHWHLGAEHLSMGQYDEDGDGPYDPRMRGEDEQGESRRLSVRQGFRCHHYKADDARFTTEYKWKHCLEMKVGQTYEIHWPHSAAGACGTPNQYQSPFYDGVFCRGGIISLSPLNTFEKIGVQAQVFTIINDEHYYYPDLIRGAIMGQGDMWTDVSYYTGSTTGTSRNNQMCSRFTPITWQVDRKCHLISASSFDKMCADMKNQRDDMSYDLHAHGSRELVAHHLAANNHQRRL